VQRQGPSISAAEEALARLGKALGDGLPEDRCLRRWSEFIRERDDHRCVDCHSRRKLSAHHICRKSYLKAAKFHTGNGITLCRDCHREVHCGFNGRPDLSLPMDAQGGEKIAYMERLYYVLATDAEERGLLRDDFYFISDEVLSRFKTLQEFESSTPFPGSRVQQAYLIWAQCTLSMRKSIAGANGFSMTSEPILPGEADIVFEDENRQPNASTIFKNPRWYRP
jgi:hypothetical protein